MQVENRLGAASAPQAGKRQTLHRWVLMVAILFSAICWGGVIELFRI